MPRFQSTPKPGRAAAWAALLLLFVPLLSACGGSDKQSGQIDWHEGQPPAAAQISTEAPTQTSTVPSGSAQNAAGPAATESPAASTETPAGAARLTAGEIKTDKPNELGLIPILEYHVISSNPGANGDFSRSIDKFRSDLAWLYAHHFHVVSVRDIIANTISAPAGTHPVALTFDDSTAGQFRYLIAADGSASIDPNSAVGAMEAFYGQHPDFGRGGYFAVITSDSTCFNWQGDNTESNQTAFCHQKIRWLLDHGYEVGNHTRTHDNMKDMTDATFLNEVGQPFEWLNAIDPKNDADILTVPYGVYPDKDKHHQQRLWMRNGFNYQGTDYAFAGVLNVGAEPTYAPDSSEWDMLFISRIQMDDGTDYGYSGYWFPYLEDGPSWLYTSDGDPATITVPNAIPSQNGAIDLDKIAAEGKTLIRYE